MDIFNPKVDLYKCTKDELNAEWDRVWNLRDPDWVHQDPRSKCWHQACNNIELAFSRRFAGGNV